MTTFLLSLVFFTLVLVLPMALARAGRGGVFTRRAVAVAAIGGRDLADVVTYTQDCSTVACLLITHRHNADLDLVRRALRDAVEQVESVERATRLRRALRPRRVWRRPTYAWADCLLWLAGIFDAGVMARLIAWRGDAGIGDLQQMTERALERFRATVDGGSEAPLLSLFEDELVRLGLLDPEADTGSDGAGRRAEPRTRDTVRE